MFRATPCSSSGESIVSIQHLVYVTLWRWPFRVQVGMFLSNLHTKRSPTQIDMYQMLYWYNWFSWWWARGCRELKKIHRKEMCVKLVIYRESEQDARSTKNKTLDRDIITLRSSVSAKTACLNYPEFPHSYLNAAPCAYTSCHPWQMCDLGGGCSDLFSWMTSQSSYRPHFLC